MLTESRKWLLSPQNLKKRPKAIERKIKIFVGELALIQSLYNKIENITAKCALQITLNIRF